MKHILQQFYPVEFGRDQDPEIIVHYQGVNPEFSLCGDDLCGDDFLGHTEGVETSKDVDCARCLEFVNHVKQSLDS